MSGRKYGKVPVAYWRDKNWLKLSLEAQWLYTFLASQPSTSPAGVFPMQTDKWATACRTGDVETIRAAGKELEEFGFIAVDSDTWEGLLIPYIADDEANDNVFKGALREAAQIQSPSLRQILFSVIQGLDRSFNERERELINNLAATLNDVQSTSQRRNDVQSAFERRTNVQVAVDGEVVGVRTREQKPISAIDYAIDYECLSCRQAQNLGPEARQGENPMWCGDCNFEAAERRKQLRENFG